jgi:hypothetical protein
MESGPKTVDLLLDTPPRCLTGEFLMSSDRMASGHLSLEAIHFTRPTHSNEGGVQCFALSSWCDAVRWGAMKKEDRGAALLNKPGWKDSSANGVIRRGLLDESIHPEHQSPLPDIKRRERRGCVLDSLISDPLSWK